MSPAQDSVASPCIQVCQLDERQVCIGCGRTINEIADWSTASAPRKHAIRAAAAGRLERMPRRPPQEPSAR